MTTPIPPVRDNSPCNPACLHGHTHIPPCEEATPPDAELRQRIETAIREYLRRCEYAAPGWRANAVDLTTELLPVVAARDAQTRAQALREAAGYARSRSADNWGAASGSPSTVLCTVSDELYARADGIHRGQA